MAVSLGLALLTVIYKATLLGDLRFHCSHYFTGGAISVALYTGLLTSAFLACSTDAWYNLSCHDVHGR